MNKLVGSIKSYNKYAKFKTCKIKTHDCVQCCCNVFIAFASRLVVSSSAAGSQSAPHLAQHCQTSPPPLNNPHHLINSCSSHESLQAPTHVIAHLITILRWPLPFNNPYSQSLFRDQGQWRVPRQGAFIPGHQRWVVSLCLTAFFQLEHTCFHP